MTAADRELARQLGGLDELERAMREIIARQHYRFEAGGIARDPITGEAVRDLGPVDRAAKVLADLGAYRDRITGLGDLAMTD
jgi:hypothetical protein